MGTPQRAQVEVRGAEGRRYAFRLGSGAICHLEDTLNLDVMEMFDKLRQGRVRLSMIREFVRAASLDYPDMTMTVEQANDLIDEVSVMPLIDAMTDSILLTFNAKKKSEEKNKKGDPRKAARKKGSGGTDSLSAPQKKES